jgi:hypothetical protein
MAGKRTIITIPDEHKTWLESYSKAHKVSVAEAVRRGIIILKESSAKNTYQTLIKSTKGLWKKGDGLTYQKKIRSEWGND